MGERQLQLVSAAQHVGGCLAAGGPELRCSKAAFLTSFLTSFLNSFLNSSLTSFLTRARLLGSDQLETLREIKTDAFSLSNSSFSIIEEASSPSRLGQLSGLSFASVTRPPQHLSLFTPFKVFQKGLARIDLLACVVCPSLALGADDVFLEREMTPRARYSVLDAAGFPVVNKEVRMSP